MLDIGQVHRMEYELGADRSVQIVMAEAPGRIHFLGEKIENDTGIYLSAAIDRYINVAISARKDNSIRFYAADLGERKRSTLVNLKYRREDRWANYLKTAIYLFVEMGIPVKGLNFSMCGNIPQQVGLASSTAIEAAAAAALRSFYHVQISDAELSQKLHDSHAAFFGSALDPADYQICLMARKDQFLYVDASLLEVEKIKSPLSRFSIIIVDSRVPRFGVETELNQRRDDTLKGLKLLTDKRDGTSFKDFASTDLLEMLGDFPERIRRRTMHIVQEIHRVYDARDALKRRALASFSKIIFHSHESLRDLYETSCPEIDWLIKRAQELEGVAGSRMTGQGFGGCTYTIIRKELAEEYKKRLEEYERIFGFRPVIYDVKIGGGARVLPQKRRTHANTADK